MKANKQTTQLSFRSVLYIIGVSLSDRTGGERKRQTISPNRRAGLAQILAKF